MRNRIAGLAAVILLGLAAAPTIGFLPDDPPGDQDANPAGDVGAEDPNIGAEDPTPLPSVLYAKLEIILDVPCGVSTTMRRIESPWGLGYYQLRARYIRQYAWQLNPTITDVTNQAAWLSSNPSVGGFSTPPGFFRGLTGGTTIVTAKYAGLTSDDFWITLPHGMTFPGPAGTGGCGTPNAQNDPELTEAVIEIIEALEPIGAWPIDPPPGGDPACWYPTYFCNRMWVTEEGPGSGGAGAWHPNGVSVYKPGISPDENPANGGGTGGGLVYLRSNRGNAVVGVDAADAYRLRELVDANGALIFPPDLSFFDMLAAIWCAWCRNVECDESEGGLACGEDEWPDPVWVYAGAVGYGQGNSSN